MKAATQQIEHAHSHAQNRFAVVPVAERLDADRMRTGRGVTIAFLDSGFYPHPDLRDRIVAYHDVSNPKAELDETSAPWQWHGTQTAVTAAGNGALCDGVYRGLASDAVVVLVKVSNRGRISDEDIVFGLEWVIANRHRYEGEFMPPRVEAGRLVFRFHHDAARSVALAGDFNGWNPAEAVFVKQANGLWRAEIEMLAAGHYEYKFVVDDDQWLDDPSNGVKVPDNHGGFNSVVRVINTGP